MELPLSAQQRRRLAVEDAPAGAAREREAGEEREEARGRGGADGRDDEHCSARSYETLDNPVMVPSTPELKTRAARTQDKSAVQTYCKTRGP